MTQFTELALKVAEFKQRGAAVEGDLAMRLLNPVITLTARRVHARNSFLRRQGAADFVNESPTLVWNKIDKFQSWYSTLEEPIRNNPSKDWFIAWCFKELQYRYLDWGRKQANDSQIYLHGNEEIPDSSTSAGSGTLDPDVPQKQSQRIANCPPIDGIILCCLTGQWKLVPADVWNSWLAELDLPESFPPQSFLQANSTQRRNILILELGISRDNLYQRWRRLKLKIQAEHVTTKA